MPTGVEGGGEVGGGTGAPRCEGPSKGDWLPLEILGQKRHDLTRFKRPDRT